MTDQLTINHEAQRQRFTTEVDGHTGYITYERHGDVLALTHTIVPKAIGGRGIAGQLVKTALDYAREQGVKVDPVCSYVDTWMQRHADYNDLRA